MVQRERPKWLIFGATSAIGRGVRARLEAAGADCTCVTRDSRAARADDAGARWITGSLPGLSIDVACTVIASLGPLDAFATWLEHASLAGVQRVIALSSTSVHAKRDSPELAERALAATLADAEARLAARCAHAGVAWTILRPTLVYGGADDASLTRIARIARRYGAFLLPAGATGLRAPVHADDVAAAVVAAVAAPAAGNRAYDLAGGEALPYREMIARVLAALPSRPRLLIAPDFIAMPVLRLGARLAGASPQLVARMREDLVFDAGPARADFGHAPRRFVPDAAMFGA
ncbi:MAG TPA: NAD-dependent epimerase/dehydratase family protein [Xanthomonadales bacterium]|nr:NAD-dependent epimerase/dehydratase family protein [Xanthomonadales bacterium]